MKIAVIASLAVILLVIATTDGSPGGRTKRNAWGGFRGRGFPFRRRQFPPPCYIIIYPDNSTSGDNETLATAESDSTAEFNTTTANPSTGLNNTAEPNNLTRKKRHAWGGFGGGRFGGRFGGRGFLRPCSIIPPTSTPNSDNETLSTAESGSISEFDNTTATIESDNPTGPISTVEPNDSTVSPTA